MEYVILDTNVFLELYSRHDLEEETKKHGPHSAEVAYRKVRACESLLLAIHLHKVRGTSLRLQSETIDILTRKVPPKDEGATSHTVEQAFTTVFIHFIKDYLLPAWIDLRDNARVASNDADDRLIELARNRGATLISNEGLLTDGSIDEDKRIRVGARTSGVLVQTPGEYIRDKINRDALINEFLATFQYKGVRYLQACKRRHRVGTDRTLAYTLEYYRDLFGRAKK